MTNETSSFPLSWPMGWPRTKPANRIPGRFSSQGTPITTTRAIKRILAELERMGYPSWNVIISTNLEVKLNGLPYANQKKPTDPGVAVYFRDRDSSPGEGKVIPVDKFTTVEQNLAAVAGTIEALRRLDRYGSGIMERAFTGFEALPDLGKKSQWFVVLNVPQDAPRDLVERQYKIMRSENHPDRGGDATQFQRITEAWQEYCATT